MGTHGRVGLHLLKAAHVIVNGGELGMGAYVGGQVLHAGVVGMGTVVLGRPGCVGSFARGHVVRGRGLHAIRRRDVEFAYISQGVSSRPQGVRVPGVCYPRRRSLEGAVGGVRGRWGRVRGGGVGRSGGY